MMRLFSTLFLSIAVLMGIWYLPLDGFRFVVFLSVGIGLAEYGRLSFNDRETRLLTLFLGLLIASLMLWSPKKEWILGVFSMVVYVTFLWGLKKAESTDLTLYRISMMLLSFCYLGITFCFWGWIRDFGKEWVMVLLFPACLTDTFGFLIGKKIGRHKMSPLISPNKTWEGFFASLVGGVFGLWLALTLFDVSLPNLWHLPFLGVGISLIAISGDLIESLIKRSVGAKDSSHLIPGHGGILDRMDALTFVAPAFYFYLKSIL